VADQPDSDRDVLTSLPRTRPARRSAKRGGAKAAAATASTPSPARAKIAKPKPKAKAKPRTTARTGPARTGVKQPRRSKVPPAGYAAPRPDEGTGSDPLGTAVQAAGELAQIGLTVSRQALKSALGRLPRP
jgi:hypothetical protein